MDLLFFPFLGFSQTRLRQQLAGKTVLITGASYGIGESVALRLAGAGAHLLLVARTAEKLAEVRRQIVARGGSADIFPCDLTQPAEVAALLATLQQRPDGVDVFVNNAGKSIRRSIFDALDRLHDFTRTMNLNFVGPVQLLLGLIPTLVARQGHVINISTISVLLAPLPKWGAYLASKGAFDQWLRAVAPELNARGVSTTTIYLPLVRTRMIAPTAAYDNVPALEPDAVARLVCRAIVARRRTYGPWWLMAGQIASVLMRRPWEALMAWRMQ